MFFTRIPVPKDLPYSTKTLQKSARYFSWIGILVGAVSAIVLFSFQFVFSSNLSIAFSMLSSILLTGAFHEDGFADSCDAFGGGYTKEKILTIMKDSRLGTYGVIGLIGVLGFKFLLLQQLFNTLSLHNILIVLIAAHATSRLMAVAVMQQYQYVQDIDASKSKPLANRKLTFVELSISILGALVVFCFLPFIFLLSFVSITIVTIFCGIFFKKWIGGYTGDCLGAVQQLTEITFYISCLLITIIQG